ncbi:MAG TPA: sigma 54-interacting transcriptional regulator, partial [Polyangiales bacterium]
SSRAGDAAALRGSGTPLYMAPELLRGGVPSVRGDIYALGATLWALITGAAPLAELAGGAIEAKLRGVLPRAPEGLAKPLRAALEVAAWALAPVLDERAPSADELLARLEAVPGLLPAQAVAAHGAFVAPRTRGRDTLLAQLVESACAPDARRLLLVTGASGMGKSTSLCEMKWRLQLGRVRVVEVRCDRAGLHPLAQLLRQLVLSSSAQSELAAVIEQIEAGSVERERLLRALVQGLAERRDAATLVVLVDDLDRAEPLLGEALRLAVHAEGGAPLTVIASAEDASAKSVLELGGVQQALLEPLAAEDMQALVREQLGAVDESAGAALLARAAGNPGVLVEAAFALRARPGFSLADVEALSVGTIGERLARARADALSPEARRVVAALAMAQLPLPCSALSALLGEAAEPAIASLQQAGLVEPDGSALVLRDKNLAEWQRHDLGAAGRRQLAAALLALPGAESFDPVLRAELAIVAEAESLALELALPAKQRLCERGATSAAARLLEACLFVAHGEHADALRLSLAELYVQLGEPGRSLEHAEVLLTRTSSETHTRALIVAGNALVGAGKLERAAELLTRVPPSAPAGERSGAMRVLARALLRQGKLDHARSVVATGVKAADASDPALPELLAIDGTLLSLGGEHELAQQCFERAEALAEQLGLTRDAAQVRGYRAFSYEREGNLEKARTEYERSLLAAREAGDVRMTATYASNLGNIAFRTGHPSLAEQNFELAAKLARRAGLPTTALLASNNLADVHVYMGSYARARQLGEAALREARELKAQQAEAQATHLLANVDARMQAKDAALAGYDRAAGLYRRLGRPREAAEALLDAGELLLDAGSVSDASLASARLGAARELIEQLGADDLRLRLRFLVGELRMSNGDFEGAVAELEAIEARLERDTQRELWWQLLAAQARCYRTLGSDVLANKKAREAAEQIEAMAARVSRDARDAFRADPRRRKVLELAQVERRESPSRTGAGAGLSQSADPRLVRLLEILKRLARERDRERVLERITDAAVELSGAERGFVLLVDDKGQLCPHLVREGRGTEQDPHVAFSRSIAEAVLIDGEPIITVNARDDARVNEYMSVHKLLLKSVACIPINGPRGVTGVLYLEHRMRAGRFRESDVDLLMAFADQAAIALENAELWSENERRKSELEAANRELSLAKVDIERLLLSRTEELEQTKRDLSRARAELEPRYARHGIVGQSPAMRRVFALIDRVTDSNVPVVVQGESGTGKELVARAIHFAGPRKKGPFVAVNCAAIPDQLLESELFGHVRGAFTGADRDRKGVFAQAHGGTLFLDEFAETSARMQIDLLRVLQEGRIRPVGAEQDLPVDVRVIVACSRPLERLVSERLLREDLYYRLSVVELRLPPLRERVEDVPLLCQHFLNRAVEQSPGAPRSISREAVERILQSGLPGNVRQLEHLLTSAAMMAEGSVIGPEDLPFEVRDSSPPDATQGMSLLDSGELGARPVDVHG